MVILYKQTEELLNGEKQMNGVKTKCASSLNRNVTWNNINWDKCEARVKKLQGRIVKAQELNRYGKVKALQYLLTTSFDAKALAVKRVTSNKGKRTAGVDHVKWITPEEKLKATVSLKKSQKKLTDKLHEIISGNKSVSQYRLIEQINPVITGWGNYFKHVASKEVFSKMDHILLNQLKRWAFRRHNNKSPKWVRNKYFKIEGGRHWCFKAEIDKDGKKQISILKKLSDIPIVRHPKIKKEANPFDPAWDSYFEKRKKQYLMLRWLSYPKRGEPV